MGRTLLVVLALFTPLVALVFEHVGNVRITERHHSHHDTYVVSAEFTRSLVLAMTFMAALGLLVAWLCDQDVFLPDAVTVLAFFDAFIVTCFVMWRLLCRFRVSTFGDTMAVTPLVGPKVWVRYDQIDRLEWSGLRVGTGFRNLVVWVGGRRAATILGFVDVEQILLSIDRFDLLPQIP